MKLKYTNEQTKMMIKRIRELRHEASVIESKIMTQYDLAENRMLDLEEMENDGGRLMTEAQRSEYHILERFQEIVERHCDDLDSF